MPRMIGGAALLLGLLVLNAPAADEKKDADKKDEKKADDKKADDKKDAKAQWVSVGTYKTVIVRVEESTRTIIVKLPPSVPNPVAQQKVAQAQLEYKEALRAKNQEAIKQAGEALKQANAMLNQADRSVPLSDEAKIRIPAPPPAFDDKGNPKKYTPAELKELKGTGADARLPGYASDISNVQANQLVSVTIVRKKGWPTRPKPDEDMAEWAPVVSVLVIERDAPPKP